MKTKALLLTFFAAMAVAALSAEAHATTTRTRKYHGTVCAPQGISLTPPNDGARIAYYNQFGALNIDPSPINFACPLTVDSTTLLPGEAVTGVAVNVLDRNTTSDVTCFLLEEDDDGNTVHSGVKQSSGGGPGSTHQTLSFTISNLPVTHAWILACSVPPPESNAFSAIVNMTLTTTAP